MSPAPLADAEIYDRLHRAMVLFLHAKGETVFGETTLRTAEKALGILQLAALCRIDGIDPKSLDAKP